jgi:hypothetical protein
MPSRAVEKKKRKRNKSKQQTIPSPGNGRRPAKADKRDVATDDEDKDEGAIANKGTNIAKETSEKITTPGPDEDEWPRLEEGEVPEDESGSESESDEEYLEADAERLEIVQEVEEGMVIEETPMDMKDLRDMVSVQKELMGEVPPWGCGLFALIEKLIEKVDILQEKNTSLVRAVSFAQGKAEDGEKLAKECMDVVKVYGESMIRLGQLTGSQNVTLEALEEKSIRLDSVQRSKNLLFKGIPEDGYNSGDDCVAKIDNVLERWLGLDPHTIKLNRCHRVGPTPQRAGMGRTTTQPRPILVEFCWSFNRLQILQRAKMLQRSGIRMEEDYPVEMEQRRATLSNIAKRAQKVPGYANTRVSGDKLLVNGKVFTVETSPSLPEAINPITQATVSNGETTLFYTRFSPLSNHCPTAFVEDETMYRHSEQYYFTERCRIFGDDKQMKKVLAAKDPKDCQRFGRQAKNINGINWSEKEEEVMLKVCLAKFRGNNIAKQALMRTGNQGLGEASKSTHWGTGLYSDHPDAHNKDKWSNNLLGNILVKVRRRIRLDRHRELAKDIVQTVRHQTPN